jgi:precorrin-2 dehydrogenase/sirohydrochlorin ferrochelatase
MAEQKHQKYFPLYVDLSGRPVLIIGAGTIASRRAGVLADFGAEVTVIAPDGTETMRELERGGNVRWLHRNYEPDDLTGSSGTPWVMVLAATDDAALNSRIVSAARAAGIPSNHAGDHAQCDFYFPAVVQTEDLVIGVTSIRQDHRLVRQIAARLRSWMKENGTGQ